MFNDLLEDSYARRLSMDYESMGSRDRRLNGRGVSPDRRVEPTGPDQAVGQI